MNNVPTEDANFPAAMLLILVHTTSTNSTISCSDSDASVIFLLNCQIFNMPRTNRADRHKNNTDPTKVAAVIPTPSGPPYRNAIPHIKNTKSSAVSNSDARIFAARKEIFSLFFLVGILFAFFG